jgi:fumarate hydratase, class II
MIDVRVESDSMGEIRIPADKLWGPQTQRTHRLRLCRRRPGAVADPETLPASLGDLSHAHALLNR